ncbi:MAG: hypothetical protein IH892_18730 [Planctomycetes bacterium]|nr:hypothetical protein [Planctomycetota bacterium]
MNPQATSARAKINLNISAQAALVIRQTKDFDVTDFIAWLTKDGFPIGSSNVMEYLLDRDRKQHGRDATPIKMQVAVDLNG